MSRRSRKAAAARDGAKWQAPLESALRKHLAPALGRGLHAEVVVAQCLGAAAAAVDQKEYALFFYAPSSGLLFACLVVIGLVAVVLYFFASASDDGGDEDGRKGQGKPVELLALFSNPALPKEAARFGLRPLAFGQDLKLLLHALPASDIDVEPAATLLSAQQALVRSSPRFLLFSGHTILEALAFESEDGRLDLHADPSFFVTLLETLNVEHERAVAAAAPAKRWTPDAKAAVYSRKREMRTAAVPPPLLREGMPSEGTVSRASPGSAPPAVARTATAPSSVRVAPLVERAVGLFAHLDDLKVAAAQKIQRYARGHLVRAQTRATFDAFFSTRGGKAARRKKVEKSAALEVSALVERFRERLGVEPPSRPRSEALARLRCVVLNGCQTDEIGRSLVRALPRLAVVCWQSVAEDSAARAFAVGFYAAVAEQLQERTRYKKMMRRAWPRLLSLLLPRRTARYLFGADPEETASSWTHECAVRAFEAGCYAFVSAGFHFGDPADYLHPPGHAHSFRPILNGTCNGCTPPVHGSIVMLTIDPTTGQIVEHRGDASLAEKQNGGAYAFSRLLEWRRRSHLHALQTNQAVPTRSPAWRVAGAVTAAMRTPKPVEREERKSRWTKDDPSAAHTERVSLRMELDEAYDEPETAAPAAETKAAA